MSVNLLKEIETHDARRKLKEVRTKTELRLEYADFLRMINRSFHLTNFHSKYVCVLCRNLTKEKPENVRGRKAPDTLFFSFSDDLLQLCNKLM